VFALPHIFMAGCINAGMTLFLTFIELCDNLQCYIALIN
jgi:hypothetical protein